MVERYEQKGKQTSTFEATVETLNCLQTISEQLDEMLKLARPFMAAKPDAPPKVKAKPKIKTEPKAKAKPEVKAKLKSPYWK